MNEKLYHYGGFKEKFGSFDLSFNERLYTIECGLVDANCKPNYKLFVAIWLNDLSPLHSGEADFVFSMFVDRLRMFEHSKDFPEEFISQIEYQAKRFEKLKAFI